ncbi:hypothetical protein [Oecophyllibacter saccharovorans]|uniref:hypothetical protein n=1 Tax=Oecophyllibacter saccharovorans TaxID=2558360 RepID=UPI001174387F|nr:hypothetical protein [Oecophyllibacter saccharovorans]TPW35054.1 hypothetical protein E3203_06130 [Oecophyllibacter saccharovorans]
MLRITINCPFCKIKEMGFRIIYLEENLVFDRRYFIGSAICLNKNCKMPVGFKGLSRNHLNMWKINEKMNAISEHLFDEFVKLISIWPTPEGPNIPEHLPETLKELFEEAEHVRLSGPIAARIAIGAYRSVLDAALLPLAEKNEIKVTEKMRSGNDRYKLISDLADKDILPKPIKEWLGSNGIRTLLTSGSHGTSKFSPEQADEIAQITRLILIYLFELPGRVAAEREKFEASRKEAEAERLIEE